MNNQSPEGGIENQKYHDFVAFTSTFYKDDMEWKVRSEAFFVMIENAKKLWIRVVVGDGGSGIDFLERVRTYENVILIPSGRGGNNKDHSMWGERRYAWKIATEYFPEANYFLWLEPEKTDLMSEASIDAILEPMRTWRVDMIVPSRKSKNTLPPQQRSAENRANRRAMDILKHKKIRPIKDFLSQGILVEFDFNTEAWVYDNTYFWTQDQYKEGSLGYIYNQDFEQAKWLDLWFGPKAFTRQSMNEDFLSYKWAKWDAIITSVLAWKQRWKNVVDVPVDFTYPLAQTELETDRLQADIYQKKRRSQYRYIIKTIRDMVRDSLEEKPE